MRCKDNKVEEVFSSLGVETSRKDKEIPSDHVKISSSFIADLASCKKI
jgi:hypothetical protein